jgi:hypothetical protein
MHANNLARIIRAIKNDRQLLERVIAMQSTYKKGKRINANVYKTRYVEVLNTLHETMKQVEQLETIYNLTLQIASETKE